jgi:serine/threonine-protein kinase
MEYEIWIRDLDRGTDTKLTSKGMAEFPVWTPDGKRLVFDWLEAGVPNLYLQPADGSAPMERLTTSDHFQYPSSMTPDGETLAFVEETAETDRDIYFLNMRDRSVRSFLKSANFECYPEFSPDGKWIAYVTDESGREEVYVRPYPEGRGRFQISHQGGTLPVWAPDGKRLFYQCLSSRMTLDDAWVYDVWAVDIETRSGFAPGKPRRLMELEGFMRGTPVRCWDISPDGRRFLTVKFEETPFRPITDLVFVQNWFEKLRRLVPVEK